MSPENVVEAVLDTVLRAMAEGAVGTPPEAEIISASSSLGERLSLGESPFGTSSSVIIEGGAVTGDSRPRDGSSLHALPVEGENVTLVAISREANQSRQTDNEDCDC